MWSSGLIEVVVALPINDSYVGALREFTSRYHFNFVKQDEFHQYPDDRWAKTDVLITDKRIPMPQKTPNLKWIQFLRYYDIEAINSYRVIHPNTTFTCAEGSGIHEKTTYGIHELTSHSPATRSLYNATVGIIGYDSVGGELARILQGFHCTVLAATFNAMSPSVDTYLPDGYGDKSGLYFNRLYPMQALPSMLSLCDFVINTLSLSNKSKSRISKNEIKSMKNNTVLVDTSHPGVTDIEAIQQILETNKITYKPSPERVVENFSPQYRKTYLELLLENLRRFLDGSPMFNGIH